MSRRLLCLACWRATEPRRALYRCDECEEPERPEWLQPDGPSRRRLGEARGSWWSRLFAGDDDPAAVAAGGEELCCPRHPETPIRLFCDCGQPLSERVGLRSGASSGLAIAGPPGAGKTLLLITMMQELHRLEIDGRPLGVVGLGDTEERFHRLSSELLDHGRKPGSPRTEDAAAEQAGETADRRFGWGVSIGGDAGRRRRRRQELLLVDDLDGDAWGLPRHARRPRLDRYLGHLGSLVFLVDGRSLAADLGNPPADAWEREPSAGDRGAGTRLGFSRVEERLGRRARRLDLALVVSKADSLWDRDEWRGLRADGGSADERRELLEELLRRSRRRDVLIEARRKFRRVELFAVSSLGFLPAPEDVDDAGHLRRHPEPAGVVEPLEWLLRQRLAP